MWIDSASEYSASVMRDGRGTTMIQFFTSQNCKSVVATSLSGISASACDEFAAAFTAEALRQRNEAADNARFNAALAADEMA